jgi:tetratricopeptide (TPR) repeat protein
MRRGLVLFGAMLCSSGCILSLDLLGLAEEAKKKKKEAATGRPTELEAWEPAQLEHPRRTASGTTKFRVRVYADEEYRLGNRRWQERIRALVATASDYTEEGFGAELVIESMRPWNHRGAKDSTVQLLQALQAEDAAGDVDWVIGFGAPLGFLTSSIHQIGMANLLGKHFVMRGIDDREEVASLKKNFSSLSQADRDAFLLRRRQHKELVIFLHEWLHNLGAIHHADREVLLHPSYAHQQHTLDDENAALVARALQARIAASRAGTAPDYSAVRAYLADARPANWYTSEREQLLASLPQTAAAATPAASSAVPALARPGPSLAALRGAVEGGRWDEAIAGCLAAPGEPGGGAQLAELCARAGMVHVAERRLAGAPDPAAARKTIASARQRFGIPPDQAASAARAEAAEAAEAARARLWFAARAALDADEVEKAHAALEPALRRYPDDCGLLALGCETAVRRSGSGKDQDGFCERAVKAWSDMPRALFWSGLAQANSDHRDVAITRLQRARELDPDFDGPWKVLADIYRSEGRRADLSALRVQYRERFGKPLR